MCFFFMRLSSVVCVTLSVRLGRCASCSSYSRLLYFRSRSCSLSCSCSLCVTRLSSVVCVCDPQVRFFVGFCCLFVCVGLFVLLFTSSLVACWLTDLLACFIVHLVPGARLRLLVLGALGGDCARTCVRMCACTCACMHVCVSVRDGVSA